MLLAVDVGNTHTLFALCRDEEIEDCWRVSTDAARTEDEYAALLLSLFQPTHYDFEQIDAMILSSVVPDALYPLKQFSRRYLKQEAFAADAISAGEIMPVAIEQPEQLGADRLVNAIAAWEKWHSALIVIDFGTATTFDVVNSEGVYIGGVIAPGVNLSLNALSKQAARLHDVPIRRPDSAIGTSTMHAMQSGIYYGYLGVIRQVVTEIKLEQPDIRRVIATGGLAELYSRDNPLIDSVDQTLTIAGLLSIHSKQKRD